MMNINGTMCGSALNQGDGRFVDPEYNKEKEKLAEQVRGSKTPEEELEAFRKLADLRLKKYMNLSVFLQKENKCLAATLQQKTEGMATLENTICGHKRSREELENVLKKELDQSEREKEELKKENVHLRNRAANLERENVQFKEELDKIRNTTQSTLPSLSSISYPPTPVEPSCQPRLMDLVFPLSFSRIFKS